VIVDGVVVGLLVAVDLVGVVGLVVGPDVSLGAAANKHDLVKCVNSYINYEKRESLLHERVPTLLWASGVHEKPYSICQTETDTGLRFSMSSFHLLNLNLFVSEA